MDESNQISVADHTDVIDLTANIVAAYVSNNSVRPADLPALLSEVHAAITGLNGTSATAAPAVEKATPSQIRKSITPDALISFIDGKPYKTLKRHITGAGMTIEEYRERFGLPRDYPSTAANYSAQRSALAKSLGLGNQRRDAAPKAAAADETVAEAPKARGRKKVAEPVAAPAEKPARGRRTKKAAVAVE
ncbi:MucR family transcriptional regulator [Methylobacterium radiotolerans]|uniref:Transcriptional regulator, MucR family n=1 Tax=Methylobacterium radiotolerans (strain ATCC 27329 / DSM 1819 / JCM 2831 / NBRC 15690 / NCIMB 10815 / 0-1) TaxID=426355 RepID=B1LW70_METRJ|nr:MucR family transcriptional regulator [Methylobacterium radiotolerans]ACB27133.1 transcriptional regulator, MucR family [Methylobacterium radiotolerans JCM 2831]